jgi:hypothetical protein
MGGAVAVFVDGDAEEPEPRGGSGKPANTSTSGPSMAAISRRSRCS